MDFFQDDFGFGDSPRLKMDKNTSKKSQANKSVKGKDEMDDIMDQLLGKQKKRQQKQKNNQLPSYHSLSSFEKGSPSKPIVQVKKESNDIFNIGIKNNSDFGKSYEPIRNRPSSKSIYDQKGSEDNRSNKSGATAKASFPGFDQTDLMKIPSNADMAIQFPQARGSMRNMMKPPLRKRAQSKAGSEAGVDQFHTNQRGVQPIQSLQDIQSISFNRPPLPKKDPSPPKYAQSTSFVNKNNFQQNQVVINPQAQIVQKQKIVYIKQQNKNIRQQFDKQLKMIKQSHEKQIQHIGDELDKQIKNSKQIKIKMMKQFEQQREKDKKLYQMMSKNEIQKIKDLYQWQIKRKTESYELQIDRLKKISQITMKNQLKSDNTYNLESQRQTLKIKQKQLDIKTKKLQDKQNFLKMKQKLLQNQQSDFQHYQKRQQQKLQQQKKLLYQMQNDLQKKKLQLRKQNQQQKISLASGLCKQQFEVTKNKQQIKLQKKQVQIAKQLFEKQKKQYEEFNCNIMKQYKKKLKQLQNQKGYLQNKQIQLYKKIQIVQMMSDLKTNANRNQQKDNKIKNNQQNIHRNIINDTTNNQNNKNQSKRQDSQDQFIKENHLNLKQSLNRSSIMHGDKSTLKQYLLKVNRDNSRKRPFLS